MKKFCAALLLLSVVFSLFALPAYANSYSMGDYQYRFKDGEIVKEPIPDPKNLLAEEYAEKRQAENGDKAVLPGDGKTVTHESLGSEVFNVDKVRGQLETAISALPEGRDTVVLRLVNLEGDLSAGDFIILRKTASNAGLKLQIHVDYVVEGKVVTRSYLNKDNMDSGYKLGVDQLVLSGVESMVNKTVSNNNSVLYVGENSGNVRIGQRLPKTMSTANLCFYSYTPSNSTYNLLPLKDVSVDDNGYVYFTVDSGGYYIVSDGEFENIS